MGFFAEIWRFFTFQGLRQGRKVHKAANSIFTKDADSIAAGYDLDIEHEKKTWHDLLEAVSQLQVLQTNREKDLQKIDQAIANQQKMQSGALAIGERAQAAGDTDKEKEARQKYAQATQALTELTADRQKKVDELSQGKANIGPMLARLKTEQEKLAKLPEEKQKAIGRFLAAKASIQANEAALKTLQETDYESPKNVIDSALDDLEAKAKVTGDLAGKLTVDTDSEYMNAGVDQEAATSFDQLLAARKLDHENAGHDEAKIDAERPKI